MLLLLHLMYLLPSDLSSNRNHTLQIHHLSHSNVKSHVCSQCGKSFKMRNSLIQHMRTHQDPSCLPTYPCQLCGKNFRIKSRLRDHLRLHNGDKPYKCGTCGKCFHKVKQHVLFFPCLLFVHSSYCICKKNIFFR